MKTTWREADDVWVCESGDIREHATPTETRQCNTVAVAPRSRPRPHPSNGIVPRPLIRYDPCYLSLRYKEPSDDDESDSSVTGASRRRATSLFYLLGVLFVFFCLAVILTFIVFLGDNDRQRSDDFKPGAATMEFSIATTWDSRPVGHAPVKVILSPDAEGNDVKMHVDAPLFNDPPNPGGTAGQPFPELYNYEVVEAFFLNDQNEYLEVELSPHGQHLILLLRGVRNIIKQQLPLSYQASIRGSTWRGDAVIPGHYFPPNVTKFNAYAIHGSDPYRIYESLYSVPRGKYQEPDFHKLNYFRPIEFQRLLPSNHAANYSSTEWN